MHSAPDIRTAETARARAIKQRNAITAVCSGAVLYAAALRLYNFGSPVLAPLVFVFGIGCGLIYANGFEYLLHRFFLHGGQAFLARSHALHHDSLGAPNEMRYVNFASSPWVVVLVFVLNALPVFAGIFLLERALPHGLGGMRSIAAGIFVSFTIYYVLYEEVHWRIHVGERLPRRLAFARRHHLRHHKDVEGCYNVFLPIFDWLFAHVEGKRGTAKPG